MIDTFEITESTADTRRRLSDKSDNELIELLVSVDHSIRQGWDHAIYYQEWSVGTDILRQRGYGYLTPTELKKLAKERNLVRFK